jgi:hypothetical protein
MLSMPILKRAYRNRCVSKFDEYDPFRLNSIHGIKKPEVRVLGWTRVGRAWVSCLIW